MLMFDKKKIATTIVAKMKDKDKPDFVQKIGDKSYEAKEVDSSKPESDSMMGMLAAADDLIKAIHAKDAKAVHAALMNHYAMAEETEDQAEEEVADEPSLD